MQRSGQHTLARQKGGRNAKKDIAVTQRGKKEEDKNGMVKEICKGQNDCTYIDTVTKKIP